MELKIILLSPKGLVRMAKIKKPIRIKKHGKVTLKTRENTLYNGNVIKATAAQNKFLKYSLSYVANID